MLPETLRNIITVRLRPLIVIEELIQMAKEFQAEMWNVKLQVWTLIEIRKPYDALANNESAVRELGDDTLKQIAREHWEIAMTMSDWQVHSTCSA